jgi:hypothetical protein
MVLILAQPTVKEIPLRGSLRNSGTAISHNLFCPGLRAKKKSSTHALTPRFQLVSTFKAASHH